METFAIHPAPARSLWFFAVIGVILLAVVATMVWSAWSARHSRVELGAEGLRLIGDLWGRTVPWSDLNVAQARIVQLDRDRELQPRLRTMGTGLPGYSAGWYRLRNGEKALVYLTDRHQVVYLPTTRGHALLLSVAEPQRFLEALARHTGRP